MLIALFPHLQSPHPEVTLNASALDAALETTEQVHPSPSFNQLTTSIRILTLTLSITQTVKANHKFVDIQGS